MIAARGNTIVMVVLARIIITTGISTGIEIGIICEEVKDSGSLFNIAIIAIRKVVVVEEEDKEGAMEMETMEEEEEIILRIMEEDLRQIPVEMFR